MSPTLFSTYIGIDYSGAGSPDSPQAGIRVFRAQGDGDAEEIKPVREKGVRFWSRLMLTEWLVEQLDGPGCCLVGIDHAFGFPQFYLRKHRLKNFRQFLQHADTCWPTGRVSVAEARQRHPLPPSKEGYRLCDRWTSSAKSLFHFDVPGSVASSTLGGLSGLRKLAGRADVHFWPFDGWLPVTGHHVLAEVYPTLWRRRFHPPSASAWTGDQRDAWTVAKWLQWADRGGHVGHYWQPPLSATEEKQARQEGWILGVV